MRIYKYIILITSVLLSFVACEVEDSNYNNRLTLQGMIAFRTTDIFVNDAINLLEIMGRVDYYAEAADSQKEGIKNYYLQEYSIGKTDKTWVLKSASEEITFTHNGKSINESGGVWTAHIILKEGNYTEEVVKDNFVVESNGDKDWTIKTSAMASFNSLYYFDSGEKHTCVLQVVGNTSDSKSPNLYDYTVKSGKGRIDGAPLLEYEIKSPLTYYYFSSGYIYSPLMLTSGEMGITADEKDAISAEIFISDSYPNYKITFDGITEIWNSYYW